MKRRFVETPGFTKRVDDSGKDLLIKIQNAILHKPDSGDVISGTGGLRKIRIEDKGRRKGKRGGYRVIYLDIPHIERTYLIQLYAKVEKIDISPDEKKLLKKLVATLKKGVGTK